MTSRRRGKGRWAGPSPGGVQRAGDVVGPSSGRCLARAVRLYHVGKITAIRD